MGVSAPAVQEGEGAASDSPPDGQRVARQTWCLEKFLLEIPDRAPQRCGRCRQEGHNVLDCKDLPEGM